MDLSTVLGTYQLLTPLIAASGTVGSVADFTDVVDFSLYGAATAKSVAPEPWSGRPPPRIAPTEFGMLNGIGIQNVGIRSWLQTYGPSIPSVPTHVWGSIVAHDIDGFAAVASAMDASGVKAIEINLSCPNLDGFPYALDPALSGNVVRSVRSATSLPI
jgi:dihydroorotate dehydrogenase (NAD+) catalytic subunit